MSTDKENNKLEDMKVDEKVDVKEEVKKAEENDVGKKNDKDIKEVKDEKSEGDTEPESKDEKEKVTTPASKKPVSKAKETKKKVEKSEEEEEEEEEEGDEEDEDEEDDKVAKDSKGVPLLDQPLQVSGARQRKGVERFSLQAEQKESAPLEIPEGRGVSLGSISPIEYNISKHKGDELKKFHQLLFGRSAKSTLIKKNIRKFNGFDFDIDSEQFEKKKLAAQKLETKGLKEIAAILNLAKSGSRDELVTRVLDFLMEPEAKTGGAGAAGATKTKARKSPALTKGGRPKRSAATRTKGYSESDDEDSDGKRAPRARRAKGKRPNLKDESSSSEDERKKKARGDDDDEKPTDESAVETPTSGDESDEDKSKKKRTPVAKPAPKPTPPAKKAAATPPAKKPAAAPPPKKADKKPAPASKRKQESEEEEEEDGESSEDEPLIKKTKAPPTDEEIKTYVKEILEGANLEEITMKTVCKQVYSNYPDFDLAHKKDFIKTTVKSLIST